MELRGAVDKASQILDEERSSRTAGRRRVKLCDIVSNADESAELRSAPAGREFRKQLKKSE